MKKKLLFLLFLIFPMTIFANNVNDGFVIKGSLIKYKQGKIVLLKNATADTLGVTTVTDGKFELKGSVEKITVADIFYQGVFITTIYLENCPYTMKLNIDNVYENKISGPKEQSVSNDFNSLLYQMFLKEQKMDKKYAQQAKIAYMRDDTATLANIQMKYEDMKKLLAQKESEIIAKNNNSLAVTYWLAARVNEMSGELLKERFALLDKRVQGNIYGKMVQEYLDDIAYLAVGEVIPNFTILDIDGKQIAVQDIAGKVKLIDFWASWCGPCRGENPNVVKLYEKYKSKGFEIVGISLDNNKEAWKKAISDDKLTWLQCSDLEGWKSPLVSMFRISGIPFTILVDADNRIIAKNLRGKELENKIMELLK